MNPLIPLSKLGLVAVLTTVLTSYTTAGIAADARKKFELSTSLKDRTDCERQLNLIHGAIHEYRMKHQRLPRWLSDLTPEFINDPKTLVCPFVEKTGNLSNWKSWTGFVPVFGDPGSCTYAYELCTEPFHHVPGWTTRDYKQRQMELLGFGVPVVRCLAHAPHLNLGFDGTLYPSRGEWEDNFVTQARHEEIFHDVSLLTNSTLNQNALKFIDPRPPKAGEHMLDLSSYYNASLFHLSQIDHSGKLLASHPEGIQRIAGTEFDIRGLIHLSARNFPIRFPGQVRDIVLNRKCAAIHFLEGTLFDAPAGAKVASYFIHYADGQTEEVPLVYSRDLKTRWFNARQKAQLENPTVAWASPPDRVGTIGRSLRLYQTTWKNVSPAREIKSIDFVSHLTDSAPFLVAITIE